MLQDQLEVGKTLAVLVKFMIAFGVTFELPVVVMLLSVNMYLLPLWLAFARQLTPSNHDLWLVRLSH